MLAYHPALDPYHTAFRLMLVLVFSSRRFEVDTLRILDFFLVFPSEIDTIRFPREHLRWRKRLAEVENPYWFSGDRLLTFAQMRAIHDTALSLLASKGLIDPGLLSEGEVELRQEAIPATLVDVFETKGRENQALLTFLTSVLGEIPLRGQDGLKDRTKLMEFRYDTV